MDIYTDKVSFISVAGVCSVRIDGQIKTDDFVIDLSTASKLIAEHGVNISKGAINLSGASKATVHGSCVKADFDVSGASLLNASNLKQKM